MSQTHSSYSAGWRHQSSAPELEDQDRATDSNQFNLITFLATAQAFQIELLPIIWDTARDAVGGGATSRIRESLINIETSFAFKSFTGGEQSDEKIFQTLINEITVLSHPAIREHPTISHLQGICWEISGHGDKPWPVLVFEKSHLRDLWHFAHHLGRELHIEGRLSLCLDIGRAISVMHRIGKFTPVVGK